MEEPSNETIYALLLEIQRQNNADHSEIKCKQDRTNGKVRALEIWRGMIVGGLCIISGVIIPIIIRIYF
jgi:hypothetical protein